MRYPVESVLRNRRRSLFAVIGIVLALSLIAGSSIAVDSSAFGMLRAAIGEIDVDMYVDDMANGWATGGADRFYERTAAMERIANVEEALPYVSVGGWAFVSGSYEAYNQGSLVFLSNGSERLLSEHGIEGAMPSRGTIAVSAETAGQLAVEVGDDVTLSMSKSEVYYDPVNYTWVYTNTTWLNRTFEVSCIWTQDPDDRGDDYYWGPMTGTGRDLVVLRYDANPVVMNIEDMAPMMEALSDFEPWASPIYEYFVWVDRDEVINLANVPGTVDDLLFIQQRINMAGLSLGFYVTDNALLHPLYDLGSQLEAMKLVFLVLSLPVVALGTYLSVVGIDLGLNERRREMGILKSRGASNRQVFWLMFSESLLLGAFAGVLGLGLGAIVSRFLLDVAVTLGTDAAASPEVFDFRINSNTVILALGFGILLMLLSSYRPLRRLSKTQVSETLHHYSHAAMQVEYKIKTDVILLSLALLSIVSTLLGVEWVNRQHGSWVLMIVLGLVIMVGVILLPLMPFLLSLSIIRMVTRGSRRLYSKLTVIVRPWTKELHYLIDKNVVRNPRRASNLGVIISLALAFGLFISVTMESSIAYEREVIKFDVGSDVRVDWYYMGYGNESSPEVDLSILDEIDDIEGVESSAKYINCQMQSAGYYYGWWASVYLIEPEDYLETVDPSDFYFDGSRKDLLDLNTNGTVIVTSSWARDYSVVVGDSLMATFWAQVYSNGSYYTTEWRFPLMVVGTVRALPGFSGANMFVDRDTLSFISDDNFTRSGHTVGSFIDLSRDADATAVSEVAADKFAEAGLPYAQVQTMEDRLEELEDDPFFGPLADFLYMEYAMSIIIMSVGVGLIIFVAVSDRQIELACIMARGSSGSQMRKILMGESISLMVLGLIVGVSVGLITALIFNELSSLDIYTEVPRRMVFTMVSLAVVLVSVGSLLAASLIATSRAGKIRLAEVLRIRGG
jgi:ABC-type lipoprotein release transport system permease subunit